MREKKEDLSGGKTLKAWNVNAKVRGRRVRQSSSQGDKRVVANPPPGIRLSPAGSWAGLGVVARQWNLPVGRMGVRPGEGLWRIEAGCGSSGAPGEGPRQG